MFDVLPLLLAEVLPHEAWAAVVVVSITLLVAVVVVVRGRQVVTHWVDQARLRSTMRRLEALGASKKQRRRLLEADHAARVGRSP